MRWRAAARILSCGIVPSIRWPVPAPGHRAEVITMERKQNIHARAAPLLSSITTASAGPRIARIRQAWLPVSGYAPGPRAPASATARCSLRSWRAEPEGGQVWVAPCAGCRLAVELRYFAVVAGREEVAEAMSQPGAVLVRSGWAIVLQPGAELLSRPGSR